MKQVIEVGLVILGCGAYYAILVLIDKLNDKRRKQD